MVRKGDIVRFLNATGGGRVVEVKGGIATVEDDDGFGIPVPVGECVPVSGADVDAGAEGKVPDRGDSLKVSLAYVRCGGEYAVNLVNSSAYSIYVQYIVKTLKGGCRARFAGEVAPDSVREMFRLRSGELSTLVRRYVVRMLPFKQGTDFNMKPCYEVALQFDPQVLARESSYKEVLSMGVKAYEVPLVFGDDVYDFDAAKVLKEKGIGSDRQHQETHRKEHVMWPLEVDLHADELLGTTAGMSGADILQYQKDYARGVMRRYYGKVKGAEVVFIHGKGDGVLKKELRRILRDEFPKCRVSDAPFGKYSTGATTVAF